MRFQQQTYYHLFVIVIAAILLHSCEEKSEHSLANQQINAIVVDAIITNELKPQKIRLSKPFGDPNQDPEPCSGAIVTITVDGLLVPLYESLLEPGLYQTSTPAAATVDKTYHLQIITDDKTYTASTYMVPIAAPNLPAFQFVPDTGLYKIVWNNPQYNPLEQAMYEAEINWGHLPAYTNDSLTKARLLYYTLNTIDVSYIIFPQDKEEVYFPYGSIAVLKKYSLNEEYTAYLRALLAETEWQGSIFEDARGNLPTNISNGGLGYFSACSVIADTVVVE